MTAGPRVISRGQDLAELCERLAATEVVAVDTEFVRERTYRARPCLVQVATPSEHALIDLLAGVDLAPLRAVLLRTSLLKVLHAARQDLEIFHALWGEVPAPVFDTQLAASVLGLGDQVSFSGLVRDVLGVEVSKAETLTDWSRRPLSPAQLRYAAEDVVRLVPLHAELAARLVGRGRQGWLESDFQELVDPALYRVEPREAWRGIKRPPGLSGAQRAVLREVAAWREEAAQERDLPRRWVVGDDVLVHVARRPPRTLEELGQARGLEPRELRRSGAALLDAVARGLATPPEDQPADDRPPRLTESAQALADMMACLVRLRALELGVTSSVLCTRAALEAVATSGEDADVAALRGWRRDVVGADLLALRDGRLQLRVESGEVRLVAGSAAKNRP